MKREKNKKERKMDKERKIGETYQIKKKTIHGKRGRWSLIKLEQN